MKNEFERMQARLPMEMLSMKRLVLFHLSKATLMKVYFLSIYLMPLKIETHVPEIFRKCKELFAENLFWFFTLLASLIMRTIYYRYELPQPSAGKMTDISAWTECVDNSQAQLEHQALRY